jgi:hypothetical protein
MEAEIAAKRRRAIVVEKSRAKLAKAPMISINNVTIEALGMGKEIYLLKHA